MAWWGLLEDKRDWDLGNELVFDERCKEETLGVVEGHVVAFGWWYLFHYEVG